ncbi:MAG: hypothetical protein JHC33_09195 [Ignisphaera sp.]|jgi:hypothetical protein|nr:hypothetical protein [Ignisphaera sp.]
MAIVIQKVKENLKYIPLSEIGDEKPFGVFVKPLTSKELLLLEDRVVTRVDEAISFSMGAFAFNVCKASIIGWENINDADGKPLDFKKSADGLPLDNTIGAMGAELIQEISNVVTAISRDNSKISVFFPED